MRVAKKNEAKQWTNWTAMCALVAGSQCIMETEVEAFVLWSSASFFIIKLPRTWGHPQHNREADTHTEKTPSVQSGCIVNSCHLPSFHSARFRRYFTPCKQNVIAIHQYGNIKSQVLHVQKIDTGITFELILTFIIYICRMIIQVSRSC